MDGRGRPRKQVCKSELVHLRVTPAEKQALLERARRLKVSLSELVLSCCLAPIKTPSSGHEGQQLSWLVEEVALPAELPVSFPDSIEKRPITKTWRG
jgi:hypothetical protein